MSVVNGQVANQTTFNSAFMSRLAVSTSTLSIVQLLNTDIASGASVLNTQALLNKLVEGVGTTGVGDTLINDYANNNYILDGDNRKIAIEKLDAQLKSTQDDLDTLEGDVALIDGRVTNLESATMTIGGNKTFSGDVAITGNLQVNGTTTSVNSANLEVTDKNILVNNGGNDASAEEAGLDVERTTTNGALRFDSTLTSKWKLGLIGSLYEVLVSGIAQTIAGVKTFSSNVVISDATQSTDKDTGSIVTEGGLGVEKNINAGGNINAVGTVTGSNLSGSSSGTNTGDVTLAAIGAMPNANGASITGQVVNLQPADGTYGGVLSTLAQVIAGAKTFLADVIVKTLIQLDGATSGFVKIQSPAAPTSWTMTLPPTSGTVDQLLRTDGTGVTTWVPAPTGGANVTLSNLGTTAINAHLLPSATNVRNLGSFSLRWAVIYGEQTISAQYVQSARHVVQVSSANFAEAGALQANTVAPDGSSNRVCTYSPVGTFTYGIGLYSGESNSGSSTGSGDIILMSGNKTNVGAGGYSGNIIARTGAVAAGHTRGVFTIDAPSTQIKTGQTLRFYNVANTFYNEVKALAALAANTLFQLPSTNGTAGQVLQTDGTGVTSWVNAGGAAPQGNKIINGDFRVSQRYAGNLVTITDGLYVLDRWVHNKTNAAVTEAARIASFGAASAFRNALRISVNTADATVAAGDYEVFKQRIEGVNIQDLSLGFAGAKTMTLSFWVYAVKTGTSCVFLSNAAGDQNYVAEFTINNTATWEYKTVTIVGPAAGTWNINNNIGLVAGFTLMAGTTYQGTAGVWTGSGILSTAAQVNHLDSNTNIFAVTGVQLEIGTAATPYEFKTFEKVVEECERYYEKSFRIDDPPTNGGNATSLITFDGAEQIPLVPWVAAPNNIGAKVRFRTVKRANATMSQYGNNAGQWLYNALGTTNSQNGAMLFSSSLNPTQGTTEGFIVSNNVSASAVLGAQGHWAADAEL
jgi:hypothetical protein